MKRAKKKRDVRVKYNISDKEIDKIKFTATNEAVTKIGMLYLVALAERGWNEDELADLFETVTRYGDYLDNKIVKAKEIQKIIESRTGITLKGKW